VTHTSDGISEQLKITGLGYLTAEIEYVAMEIY
jgi:hypothetical protein